LNSEGAVGGRGYETPYPENGDEEPFPYRFGEKGSIVYHI
jgi:hypothetical protein